VTLNRRLLFGLAPLLCLFLAMGLYAIHLFGRLGNAIDVILRENYASVVASQKMQESADQMDTALLYTLDGETIEGRQLFDQANPVFEKNLDVENHNITLPGEGELAAALTTAHAHYLDLARQFFALAPGSPARRTLYFDQLRPAHEGINHTATQILDLNQQNMVDANNQARELSHTSSRFMVMELLASFLIATAIAWLLARALVRPIRALTDSAQELGEGRLDQHVLVESRDELGELARAFNRMAAKLRAYRQSTTEQILQAQQTTESALRAFPDPILVFSSDKQIRLQNLAGELFLRAVGGSVEQLVTLPDQIEQVLNGGSDYQPGSFDKAISVSSEAGEKFYLPRVLAMRSDTGSVMGVVVVLQDVTRFRVADDVKTDLIATVSHEFKTPLTSMQMAVYLLLEEKVGPLNPRQIDLLMAARNNSDRLFEMIEDLLDLARFEGGAALIEKKPVDAGELVSTVATHERDEITSRGLALDVKIEPHLPRVAVSRTRIEQVFANFISNAIKHSPSGGHVTLSATKADDRRVRFAVKDEGEGIPRELHRRVFDKFFRRSESSDRGAGLGLSIAREIVLAHGGNIGVESREGEGSEFYFVLPAV
jgi:signal transduction histidine kinase